MLFNELIIKDFLSFKGLNKIKFPTVNKNESSLILILAANNSGKTNILRALRFLLYGDLLGLQQEKHKLINSNARNEAKSEIQAFVEATINFDNKLLTFRRTIYAIKSGTNCNVNKVVLGTIIHESRGDKFYVDEGRIQRNIELLVPRELFDYFYFQGEELAKQLMEGSNRSGISSGIYELLHLDDWKRAAENVALVKQKYLTELKALESSNKEYKRVLDSYEQFLASQKNLEDNLIKAQSSEKLIEERLNTISYELIQISEGQPNQQRTDLLRKCQSEEQNINREIDNLDMQICKAIGDSKGIVFLSEAFDSVSIVLKKMQDENLLPADITDGFVERLLKKEICICGRSLHADCDQEARSHVEEYRNKALSEELNSGLLNLLNNLEANAKYGYLKKIASIRDALNSDSDKRRNCIVKQHDLKQRISELVKELSDPRLGEIARLVKEQKELSSQKEQTRNRIFQLVRDLNIAKKKVADLSIELKKLSAKSNMKEEQTIQQCHLYAKNLEEIIKRSIESLKHSFYEIMQASVSECYNSVVTDDTKASIHRETLLPSIVSPQGEIVKTIGGGQRQLLVMTHIISLCQLRKELHRQLNDFGIHVGKLDDQSFFFDSIFAPTDDEYSKRIAQLLYGKARQVLLLLASQQWHDNIRNVVEPQVDKLYRIVLNTAKTDLKEEDYVVKFKNKRIPLINLLNHNQSNDGAFSQIEEIR